MENIPRTDATNESGDNDDVTSLKQSCRAYAGSLTRKFRELESCMLSVDNYDTVVEKADQLDKTFNSYEERFYEYHERLTGQEADSAMDDFKGRQRNKEEFDARLRSWMVKAKESAQEMMVQPGSRGDDDNVSLRSSASRSSRSSRRSTSTTSSAMLRDARIKAEQARLKVEHVKKTQELRMKQMQIEKELATIEAANEMQQAEVEIRVLQEEIENESPASEVSVSRSVGKGVKKELNTNAPVFVSNQVDVSSNEVATKISTEPKVTDVFSVVDLAMSMPKPEMTKFDGNPLDYCGFMNKFEATIECKPVDNKVKLMYLIQFCVGKARESIENCTFLGSEGYQRARQILHDQFGQSFQVTTAHMKKVLNRQQIRPNDGNALWDLARAMRRCEMVLSHMGYRADMDSSGNLLQIQQLMPVYMQTEWAKRAHNMMKRGITPTFNMMADYVEECAQLANNMFGRNIGSGKGTTQRDHKTGTTRRTALSTQAQPQGQRLQTKCPCCSQMHNLDVCKQFKQKSRDERLRTVRDAKLCDNCFKPFHFATNCKQKSNCKVDGCKWRHHTLLHRHTEKPAKGHHESVTTTEARTASTEASEATGAGAKLTPEDGQCHSTSSARKKVCLRVVPVRISGNGGEVRTWALLDEGSDVSLCDEKLVRQLGIQGVERNFQLSTVGNTGASKKGLEVKLTVKNIEDGEGIRLPKVWTVRNLNISSSCIPTPEDLKGWRHLEGLELPNITGKEVQLLIGGDTPEAFWMLEQRRGNRKEPYAVKTILGWTVLGPTKSSTDQTSYQANFIKGDDALEHQLKRFWQLDHDVGGNHSLGESIQDQRAKATMDATVNFSKGHYEVGLPWKHAPPHLPDNRQMADMRLKYLKRRLLKDDHFCKKYTATMQDYIDKGYAEEVPANDITDQVWYLPHHPVLHPHKPEKVRVVFDCAARYQGTSLNDQLLQGPDYTNSLVGVLTRFRKEPVAMVGDIEAMFHQVKVPVKDRDALRFLWWKDGDLDAEPKEYRMTVHLFGATSSPSCASYALRKTAEENQTDFDEEVVSTVRQNFYVDDCLKSVATKEEGQNLIQGLCKLLKKGGFRLTKWLSNDMDVLASIPQEERAQSVVDLDLDHLPIERTLGVLWNVETDDFGFKVHLKEKPATRRGILSMVSSLYDPLGFLAPFILRAKLLLQFLCRRGVDWDERVTNDELQRWKQWLDDLPLLTGIKIPRCLKPPGFETVKSCQLHHFCDASQNGYAAVSYLRLVDEIGNIHCSFIMGKSRLCPLKNTSIPRLELTAAVLAVDLNSLVQQELQMTVESTTYWTDSTSVLQYIRNESRRFQTFVANRVAKIHEATTLSRWRHVGTTMNPADDGSRGMKAKDFVENSRWLTGPEFLQEEEDAWPKPPDVLPDLPEGDVEVKKTVDVNYTQTEMSRDLLQCYSTWDKLMRSVAWLLRYKEFLRMKVTRGKQCTRGNLTLKELRAAQMVVIRMVQRQEFPDELQGKSSRRSLEKLAPQVVNGVLRVGGRIGKAAINFNSKHPIILPHDHHVTRLIIEHHHHLVGHSGAGMTWSSLREQYWIVKGGAAVRHVIGKCLACKRRNAKPSEQVMAELPEERVNPVRAPFTYVGVDYFGPLYVKQGRSRVKRYGCIFTCLTMRAVHIELTRSLDTDSFINALRRFISRRGAPEKLFSDNGTNFRGAEKELRKSIDGINQRKVENFLHHKSVEWTFNPPAASHMGGIWERMIRSVRRILKNMSGEQVVCEEVLTTTLTEIEGILNARPLTRISMDANDEEPLTPNHLLLLRSNPNVPPGVFNKDDNYGRRRWRQVQYLASIFWKRWRKEYLSLLQERQRWTRPQRNLAKDDLVLLIDDNLPRGQWSLGKVVEVYPGRDGRVRQVEVRVGHKHFRRPVVKLCLLEASNKG
ncbi:uncharacterized protein [Diadema setosum]|uniref:uncharacterized protein n=1 Tax=Diadema setosum TaxID=31175 RepID=UPI003B3A05D9